MIPRQVNLPGIWYPGESLFFTLKFEYLSEISTKIENILTHWSVTQTGSNEEKNWRSKISLDCPFKESYNIPWSSGFPLTFGKLAWRKRERERERERERATVPLYRGKIYTTQPYSILYLQPLSPFFISALVYSCFLSLTSLLWNYRL